MLLWLLQNTVLAALLAVGVAVVCRLTRPNPAVRHALWLVVLVRLLMPPGLHWPWAIPDPLHRDPTVAVLSSADLPDDGAHATVLEDEQFLAVLESTEEPDAAPAVTVAPAPPGPPQWPGWLARAALVAWGTGAIVVLFRHVCKVRRLRGWLRAGEPAPVAMTQRVHELAGKLRIRAPRVLAVPGLTSPLVGGLPRPVLLWPAGLEQQLPPEGVRAVLAHELAHLRRRDHWVRWLELAAGCVMWWNPLFALVRRKIRQYAEQACDAWVVNLMPKARRAYAEALLTVCETVSRVAEPAPALGVGGDDRRDFQRRLTMILRDPVACRPTRRTLLAVGVLALIAVPGWTLGQTPADKPADPGVIGNIEVVVRDGADVAAGDILLDLLVDADDVKAQPPGSARDKKLAELEVKIQALLKEIQAMKAEKEGGDKVRGRVADTYKRKIAEAEKEGDLARAKEAEAVARAKEMEQRARLQAEAARAQAEAARDQAERARRELERALEFMKKKAVDESSKRTKDGTDIARAKIELERALGELKRKVDDTGKSVKESAEIAMAKKELERALADLGKKAGDASKTAAADLLRLARMKEELGEKLKAETADKLKIELAEKMRSAGPSRRDGSQSRASYTLPEGKAKALAAFVKEHLKATVTEISLDGDKLTVTTTPEGQRAIGQLVELMRGQTGGTRYRIAPDKEKPK